MNLFQKLYNHELVELLQEERIFSYHGSDYDLDVRPGPFVPLAEERMWLKHFLEREEAGLFFREETLEKLWRLLKDVPPLPAYSHLTVKGRPEELHEWSPIHRSLRESIINRRAIIISYFTRNGDRFEGETGFPIRLQFNIVKKQWNLIWVREAESFKRITPLFLVETVERCPGIRDWPAIEEDVKEEIVIKVSDRYDQELQRLFLTFSCFEKQLNHNDGRYTIAISYYEGEREYILSRIRMLGPHVEIQSPEHLRTRMKQTAHKALSRYL